MNKNQVKFYLFGDSICYGQLVSVHNTWVSKLASSLELMCKEKIEFFVQNAGVNGNTTRQALERLYYDVTSHRPDYVLVQFGMNDCNYWETDGGMPRVSPESFRANLEEIVAKCSATGVRHTFLNTNHPSLKGSFKHLSDITYDDSNKQYNTYIREAYENLKRQRYQISLNDIESSWTEYLSDNISSIHLSDLLLADGIHLSLSGHDLYARLLIPVVTTVIVSKEL
jgi:lysophospholipase L1-like esterase